MNLRRVLPLAAVLLMVGCGDDGTSVVADARPADGAATTAPTGPRPEDGPADDDDPAVLAGPPADGGLPADDPRWESDDTIANVSSIRTSADGRTLVVAFTGGEPFDPGRPCSTAHRTEATETPDRVTLRYSSASAGLPGGEPVFCTLAGRQRTMTVELDEPLGQREVVHGDPVRSVGVFDGELLAEPTWLPDGWQPGSEGGAADATTGFVYWGRSWGPVSLPPPPTGTACSPSGAGVWLAQGRTPRALTPITGVEPVGTHDVNGSSATYSIHPTGAQSLVTWETDGQWFDLISSSSCTGDTLVPLETLLRIARSLVVPPG